MTDRAQVVIIGGGIAGASIAYHLTQLGTRNVLVLEQSEFVSGTTSHAPGLVGQLRSSVSLSKMPMHSVALYRELSVDGVPGYDEIGSLRVASSKGRVAELQQQARFAATVGLEAHLLTAREAAELFPLMTTDSVEGALYIPTDGSANAPALARALIAKAQEHGATFQSQTRVTEIAVRNDRVTAVTTSPIRGFADSTGRVECETLVIATGIWSPPLARMAGVALALVPMQHQYVQTASLPELAGRVVPNLRDPDKLVYLRQQDDTLIVGGYERNPRVFAMDIPVGDNPTVLTFDADHFAPLQRAAAERVPALVSIEAARQVNGLESFTPDGEYLLGPASQITNLWFACGFCAHGVSGAGGVGQVMAEWIVAGEPSVDVSAMDVRRFDEAPLSVREMQRRACEIYGTYYDLSKPE